MISKFKKFITETIKQLFSDKSEVEKISENIVVEDNANQHSYIGVVAPVSAPYDPWFCEPVKTEKVIEHEEMVEQHKTETATLQKEPENIHQMMYEMATKNWTTVKETLGGSENFHEGLGGWNSGTGMNQFKP